MYILEILNTQLSIVEQVCFISIFALIFGSFASLISHRLATEEPITFARSKCTKCDKHLTVKNLIPLFSWIFQGGKCSNCKVKISIRYPLIELSFLISFLIVYFSLGQQINIKMVIFCLMAGTLIVMSVVDLEHYFIPNSTQYFLAFLVATLQVIEGGTYGALENIGDGFVYVAFGLFLLTFFYFTTRTEAIGIDDVKFFFIAGLMLGTEGFLFFMLTNGLLGTIFGAIWQRIKREQTFPFAPAICIAFFVSILYGDKVNLIDFVGSLIF